jgi:hypothetical protein
LKKVISVERQLFLDWKKKSLNRYVKDLFKEECWRLAKPLVKPKIIYGSGTPEPYVYFVDQ